MTQNVQLILDAVRNGIVTRDELLPFLKNHKKRITEETEKKYLNRILKSGTSELYNYYACIGDDYIAVTNSIFIAAYHKSYSQLSNDILDKLIDLEANIIKLDVYYKAITENQEADKRNALPIKEIIKRVNKNHRDKLKTKIAKNTTYIKYNSKYYFYTVLLNMYHTYLFTGEPICYIGEGNNYDVFKSGFVYICCARKTDNDNVLLNFKVIDIDNETKEGE